MDIHPVLLALKIKIIRLMLGKKDARMGFPAF